MAGVGQKIAANDYNTIQTTISQIFGKLGTGYGQSPQSNQVATANTITAAQWNALQADITAVNYHQLNAAPAYDSAPLTTATKTIKIKDADRAAYLAVAQALLNSSPSTVGGVTYPGCYALAVTGQKSISPPNFPVSSTRISASQPWGGATSEQTISNTITLTFASVGAAEYFFNSGSSVNFTASASAGTTGTTGTKDYAWAILLSSMGTVSFSYYGISTTGSGSTSSYGWSYFNANRGSTQQVFSIAVGSGSYVLYSPSKYVITVSVDSTGTIYTFSCKFEDIGWSGHTDESVTATVTNNINLTYASGSYVTVTPYLPTPGTTVSLTN